MRKCTRKEKCVIGDKVQSDDQFRFRTQRGKSYVSGQCLSCEHACREATHPNKTGRTTKLDVRPPPQVTFHPPKMVATDIVATVTPLDTETPSYLVIGDIHAPFHNKQSLQRVIDLNAAMKPDAVVQIGDAMDMFSWSRYARSHNIMTPQQELYEGRRVLEYMWGKVHQDNPEARLFQLLGNHDMRLLRYCLGKAPELEQLVGAGLRELYTFPHVETVLDDKEELQINDIWFVHGELLMGRNCLQLHAKTVSGHSHKGGLWMGPDGTWELNAGWIGDVTAPCFSYAARRRAHGTSQGVGWIDHLGPRFIPFP